MAVVISNKERFPETWEPGEGNRGLIRAGTRCNCNTEFRKWSNTSSSLAADETQSRMHMHKGQEYDANVVSALKYKT